MNNIALKTVTDFNMLEKGDSVVVGVSGGADSIALICFLLEIRSKYDLTLTVCHVNHALRGKESDGDEQFVKEFCDKNGIEFLSLYCDVSRLSKEQKMGFEECGRQVRYDFFKQTAEKKGGNVKIATAHTLCDVAETLIFNISRGSSQNGLCSIAPMRDNIIRPLIYCTREQIEEYLYKKGQAYRTDSSNLDTSYTRNYIRHKIIPEFLKLNPNFYGSVKNLTEIMREQSDFFKEDSQQTYHAISQNGKIDLHGFSALQSARKRALTAHFLSMNGIELSKARIDEIISLAESKRAFRLSVSSDFYICGDGEFLFSEKQAETKKADFCYDFSLGEFDISGGRKLRFSLISRDEYKKISKNSKKELKNCLDYDIIKGNCQLRTRKDGDYICIFPRNVTKTLKKLLNESKIDSEKRYIIPLLASGNHVLWGEQLGVDKSAAVFDKSERILYIEIQNETETAK